MEGVEEKSRGGPECSRGEDPNGRVTGLFGAVFVRPIRV